MIPTFFCNLFVSSVVRFLTQADQPRCFYKLSPLWNAMSSCFNTGFGSSLSLIINPGNSTTYYQPLLYRLVISPRAPRGDKGRKDMPCYFVCLLLLPSSINFGLYRLCFWVKSSLFLGYVVLVFGFMLSLTLTLSKS